MERHEKGFTLVEILIAVSIVLLLMMVVFLNLRGQSARAMDSKRKTDLYRLQKALEEYYNDAGTFPEQSIVNSCNGASLAPYLAKIPCDPATKTPYGYFPSTYGGYRLCAKLADTTDPAIVSMGCNGPLGCGVGGGYNYCLPSGVTASAVGTEDEIGGGGGGGEPGAPTPLPTPAGMGATTTPGQFACAPADFLGNSYCKSYSDPVGDGCPKTYLIHDCLDECQTYPAVRCSQ
jgi:prepilin-type N-terminal cleavage/methylation domain-containing protein